MTPPPPTTSPTPPPLPKAGDVVHLTRAASVQFTTPIFLRVIRVMTERITYDQWVWLEGYQLDASGDAVEKRALFVLREGLRIMRPRPKVEQPAGRQSRQAGRVGQAGRAGGRAGGAAGDRVRQR